VSPIADHQVSSINTTTTTTTSPTTNDDAATSASIPHANSKVQSVPVASSIAITAFDVTAVTSSDAVVQKHLLTTTTTTTAPTANEGKKKDARLINAIAPSAAAAVTATNTAPTTSTSSSSSLKLKDAFASKNLITSIVSNYNAALASPTPLLQQSASVPSISMHPVNATTIATTTTTDSLASASSVTSSSLSDTVLSAATTQQQQVNEPSPSTNDEEEYIIEDRESSDDESGTDDEESEEKKKQSVPEWARGTKLREALELQYGFHGAIPMDPDLIFPEVQSCSLEEIFGCREGINRKYHNRTSSAHWDADELTLVEKRTYRKHMGYDKPAMVGGI